VTVGSMDGDDRLHGGSLCRRALPGVIVVLPLAAGAWLSIELAMRQAAIEACPAYVMALERAAAAPPLVDELGTPLDPGFPMGGLVARGEGVQLEVEVKVRGPRGEGALFIAASSQRQAWRFQRLEVQLGPGRTLDLRSGDRAGELQ
jgi:hypothetical protein